MDYLVEPLGISTRSSCDDGFCQGNSGCIKTCYNDCSEQCVGRCGSNCSPYCGSDSICGLRVDPFSFGI